MATKAPWPAVDGGRLLLQLTLEALAAAGHEVDLVAPVDPRGFDLDEVHAALSGICRPHLVPAPPRGRLAALARARLSRAPLSVSRHTLPAVGRQVARLARAERFDLVHAEQLQAVPQALAAGLPLVLRAQNVESDLWGAASRRRGGLAGRLLAAEARRLAAAEGDAVRRAAATVALTAADAARLAELAAGRGGERPDVYVVAAPFPPRLPLGGTALFGDPPVVVLGSAGWLPNADSARWFAAQVWPAVRRELPGAVLHLFGGAPAGAPWLGVAPHDAPRFDVAPDGAPRLDVAPDGAPFGAAPHVGSSEGIVAHPAPADSAEAFAPRAILAVPLRIASGVRMKILEAWARGVPVVATPEAVAGLDAVHGREVLVGQDGAELAAALARLHREPALARALVEAGRRQLAARHAPAAVVARLAAIYAAVSARATARR